MTFELVVLGCSGSGPAPGVPASGYLVRTATTNIWLDAGTGTFMELARYVDPVGLDAVVLSHLHADHCVDFLGFFHYVAYRNRPPERIPVFLPPGAVDRIAGFLDAGADDHAFWEVFRFDEVTDPAPRRIGDIDVRFAPADHSIPAIATRCEHEGRSVVYSGDTGPTGGFIDLARDADVVVSEAGLNPSNDGYPFHLSGADAGRIAALAGVRRLILTHLAPTLSAQHIRAAAAAEFPGPIDLAEPGLVVPV